MFHSFLRENCLLKETEFGERIEGGGRKGQRVGRTKREREQKREAREEGGRRVGGGASVTATSRLHVQ